MASDLVPGNVSLLGRPKPRRAALWWELRRAPWISLFIIFAVVFVAVFAPVIAPYPPNKQSLREKLLPPAWQGERVENAVARKDVLG